MNERKHNGWTNYETWAVKLWLDNEEGSSNYWNERAAEVYRDCRTCDTFSRPERAALDLADVLKDEIQEGAPEVEGLYADLLNASMSEVNWYEIGKAFIDDLDEDTKKDIDAEDAAEV